MPIEMTPPKYYNLKETAAGTVLLALGQYVGPSDGRFGLQHNFIQHADHQHVVLNGGAIDWRVEQGHIREGEYFDITFEGKGVMEKGNFKGKEVNNYKIEKYSDEELKDKGITLKVKPTVAPPEVAAQPVSTSEALDDLE